MIVKNEEEVIGRCLQSVNEAADECIVVDTGSTDRTVEIARQAGAQVCHREWQNDFAAARNESIALAKGKWILVLDADEVLEDGHGPMIRQLVTSNPQADGFFVKIANYTGTQAKPVGSSISSSLRLFRNKPGYRYAGRIHEQIVQPIITANPAALLLFSDIRLNHGGYLPEVVQKKNKVQRNMELLHQELEHTDNESFHRYNLGVEYMRMGDNKQALEQFRRSRSIVDWRKSSFGHVVVLREVNCLQALGQWEEAAAVCGSAAETLGDFPDLFLTLGRIRYHLKQWEAAEAAFYQALEIGVAPPKYTSSSGAGTYTASFHLGKTKEQLQDYEGAVSCYANALKFNPGLLAPFLRLIGLLARSHPLGHAPDGITHKLEQLFTLESPNTWWSIALSYYQLGLYREAAAILRSRPLPEDKGSDGQLLLLRCRLLAENGDSKLGNGDTPPLPRQLQFRRSFYQAVARNEDQAAFRFLSRMELEYRHNRQKAAASPSPAEAADPDGQIMLSLHRCLALGLPQQNIPLNLPPEAYSPLWSELHFLYMLAAKEHLFALQALLQAYWRQLLNTLPDPLQRLKGRCELIKTTHVRIYQLFREEKGHQEYNALWNDVLPRLMTLIDDILMEEVT
jgi:tetratricopeptide (TPR) repeat protein